MSDISDLELDAINALQQRNYDLAEKLYIKLISKIPSSKEYNNNIANIYLIKKQTNLAIKYYLKALNIDTNINQLNNQSIAYNLSCAYQIINNLDNTIKYLALTLTINPNHQAAINKLNNIKSILLNSSDNENNNYYNIAVIFHKIKDYKQAEKYYLLSLENLNKTTNLNSFETNYNLGSLYQKQKKYEKACFYYKVANDIKSNPNTEFLINSIEQNNNIIKPPEEYISNLFDYYSDNYENDLINNLEYKVPEYFYSLFQKHISDKQDTFNVLDLGCGTGLIAQKFQLTKHKINNITGTDLSQKMLNIAKQKNIYKKLYYEDIIESLNNINIIKQNINLILAADVLVYLGDLDKVFLYFKKNFDNSFFIFSCESTNKSDNYNLTQTGRYQHNKKYILELISKYNIKNIFLGDFDLRNNNNNTVSGQIWIVAT